ncbi:MAG: tol-pal system protein YbgF [Alphaproteobacteria bacterium]|nr:tol-pal system protein YbgF [Alphaproteobacteria bacterium]
MKKTLILSLLLLALTPFQPVLAQEMVGIQDQLDAIKEELIILNRKVYRDQADSAVSITSSGTANLSEYDEIIRSLNGKFEELEYKMKQMDERISAMNKDIDTRFNMIEGKPIAAASGSLPEQKKFGPSVANGAPKSIVGDTITSGSLKDLGKTQESVDSLYKKGLEALKNGDLIAAEQHFQLILNDYSSDKLAGNAQYWLGEVYYKDKNYAKAAVAFGKGYEKYKNGNKGADSLYKLGLSMSQLGKKAEACTALKNMPTEFPKADSELLGKAKSQATKLGCK